MPKYARYPASIKAVRVSHQPVKIFNRFLVGVLSVVGERVFLKEMHYFRAFAIGNIVAAHAWRIQLSDKVPDQGIVEAVGAVNDVLFHGSTLYFLFISGFLFHHIAKRKFSGYAYYRSKLTNIYMPYALLTVIIVSVGIFQENEISHTAYEIGDVLISNLVHGKAQIQYWYLPFMVLVFIVSPILLKIPVGIFEKITIAMLFLPLLGTRSGTDVAIGQYVYFFPIYLVGVYSSMKYASLLAVLAKHKVPLLFIAILTTVVLFDLRKPGNTFVADHVNILESLHYVQKISIGSIALLLLHSIRDRNIRMLDIMAKYSFAIYFIHNLVSDMMAPRYYAIISYFPGLLLPASIIFFFLVVLISLLVITGLRKLFNGYSKYIIGA